MAKLNKLIFEKTSYVKDGVTKEYTNAYLDVTYNEYRYRIPLSCSDKGELAKVFRDIKADCEGLYDITFEE